MITAALLLTAVSDVGALHRVLITAGIKEERMVAVCRQMGEIRDIRSVAYLESAARKYSGNVRRASVSALTEYFGDFGQEPGPEPRTAATQALRRLEMGDAEAADIVLNERRWPRIEAAMRVLEGRPLDGRLIPRLLEFIQLPLRGEKVTRDDEGSLSNSVMWKSVDLVRENRVREAAPLMAKWLGESDYRQRYGWRYFEEVAYEPVRALLSSGAPLAARVRQGDDGAFREAIQVAKTGAEETLNDRRKKADALKAIAVRGDSEARDVLIALGSGDAGAWLVRIGDMRGWRLIARTKEDSAARYFQLPKGARDAEALEGALREMGPGAPVGQLFSFDNQAGLDALERLATDSALVVKDDERLLRMRFRVVDSPYRQALTDTQKRLQTELDGTDAALGRAWARLALHLREVLTLRFDAEAIPARRIEKDWRAIDEHGSPPLYVSASNMPDAVYVKFYCAQIDTLDPEKGRLTRDPQAAFLFWKNGTDVWLQNVTRHLEGRLIPDAEAGHVARIGDRLVLAGAIWNNPHSELFAQELRLVGNRWTRGRRLYQKEPNYGSTVLVSATGTEFRLSLRRGVSGKYSYSNLPW